MTDGDMKPPKGKMEVRRMAQDEILHAIALGMAVLADRDERRDWPEEMKEEFEGAIYKQRDRVARFFGYTEFPFVGY